MNDKVAFITGASRGVGAESAVALAKIGYRVAITARTLCEGEAFDHAGHVAPLPGSLEATAAAVEAVEGEALCLRGDILNENTMIDAVRATLGRWGRVDLLFNNAAYQGRGNQERLLDVTSQQLQAIYQGNVFTPLALIKECTLAMAAGEGGLIINMLSYTAFNDPPAPADQGGWGFAYPSSKAALGRMAGAVRAEHSGDGIRIYNMEPGTVVTEVMKAEGIDEKVLARYRPCTAAAIAGVVAWLAENEPREEWEPGSILHAPAIAKELNLLTTPTLLGVAHGREGKSL